MTTWMVGKRCKVRTFSLSEEHFGESGGHFWIIMDIFWGQLGTIGDIYGFLSAFSVAVHLV